MSSVAEGVVVNGTRLTLAFSKALATLGSNTPEWQFIYGVGRWCGECGARCVGD